MSSLPLLRWWRAHAEKDEAQVGRIDRAGWRIFFLAMVELAGALLLALYSSSAAESGRIWLAGTTAAAAVGSPGTELEFAL